MLPRRLKASILPLLLLFPVASLAWSAAPPEPSSLAVGWAKIDVTPSFPCPLAGYGKRWGEKMHGVHDPLYVRALALEGSGERIALVSVDLLVIPRAVRSEVERRLAPLHFTALLVAATHTHSGLGGYWDNGLAAAIAMGRYDEQLFALVVERIVHAVQEADAHKCLARVGVGEVPVDGLNRNRQQRGGPVDPALTVIRFDDAQGQPLAALVNFSAHATVLGPRNLLLSADYPGAVTAALETWLPVALFTAGASGNLSPRSAGGTERYARVSTLGLALAEQAVPLIRGITTSAGITLHSQTREVRLPQATTR